MSTTIDYQMRVYRYDVRGPLSDGMVGEIRRAHHLRNRAIAPLKERGPVEETDDHLAEASRRNSQSAGAGELRAQIRRAAGVVGCVVEDGKAPPLVHHCGTAFEGRERSHLVRCPCCDVMADQDVFVVRKMRDAAASGRVLP